MNCLLLFFFNSFEAIGNFHRHCCCYHSIEHCMLVLLSTLPLKKTLCHFIHTNTHFWNISKWPDEFFFLHGWTQTDRQTDEQTKQNSHWPTYNFVFFFIRGFPPFILYWIEKFVQGLQEETSCWRPQKTTDLLLYANILCNWLIFLFLSARTCNVCNVLVIVVDHFEQSLAAALQDFEAIERKTKTKLMHLYKM